MIRSTSMVILNSLPVLASPIQTEPQARRLGCRPELVANLHLYRGQLVVEPFHRFVGEIETLSREDSIALVEDQRHTAFLRDIHDDLEQCILDLIASLVEGIVQSFLALVKS